MRIFFLTAVVAVLALVGCNKQSTTVKGKGGEILTLTAPKTVVVNAGETVLVKLAITREQFDDPVNIEFVQLPDGVTIVGTNMSIAKGEKEATFTLKAADDAKGMGHAVKVSASAHGMKAGPEEFTLNIAEKKGSDLSQKRTELEKNIHVKVDDANKAITALEERAKKSQGTAKTETDAMVVNIQKARDGLEKQLVQARTTSAEAWDEFSRGIVKATQDLQDATTAAWNKVKG
jgi:hypothetical protein